MSRIQYDFGNGTPTYTPWVGIVRAVENNIHSPPYLRPPVIVHLEGNRPALDAEYVDTTQLT